MIKYSYSNVNSFNQGHDLRSMENYIGKDYRRLKKDKFSINKI